jgi:two-component system, chemotaxis family, chemotaxis protein CheY
MRAVPESRRQDNIAFFRDFRIPTVLARSCRGSTLVGLGAARTLARLSAYTGRINLRDDDSDQTGGGRPGTVFVVEDDVDLSEAVAEILRDAGYGVVCACNGLEALEYLRRHAAPSVMLLDLFMPVMDGWQVLKEVERDSALSGMPVIVMTAAGGHESPPIPSNRMLRKPMNIDSLIGEVRNALDRH